MDTEDTEIKIKPAVLIDVLLLYTPIISHSNCVIEVDYPTLDQLIFIALLLIIYEAIMVR
jgi:hypothetical protein